MATQEQDTFATGGRGTGPTIAAINPASNGDTWNNLAGTSSYSFSGTRASLTGSNGANLASLQNTPGKKWISSVVVARLSKTNTADSVGVAARIQNSSNYYHARVNNGNLTISLFSSGANTDLASVPCGFTDTSGLFWIKFQIQGFGMNGAYQNIQAKCWLDGNAEPAAFMVSASDGTIINPGMVGFRLKANNNNSTQTIDSFSAIDTGPWAIPPAYNVTEDLPIGITEYFNQTQFNPVAQQVISDLQGWGNGVWMREQIQWQAIEWLQAAPGFYTWDQLDDLVYRCNVAGIRICACIQGAPSWYLTIKAADGSTIGTVGTGGGDLPDPASYAAFAQALTTRYNGKNGYGYIEMAQIFNEDLDANSYPNSPGINRDVLGSRMATYVNLAYPLMQAASPTMEIAIGAVRKTATLALAHITNWMINFFSALSKSIQNFRLDGHYYRDGSFNPDPTTQNVDTPSAATEAFTILSLAVQYGFPNATLMYGECGWNHYDDGSGINGTLSGALTQNVAITSIPVNALAKAIPDATPITLDYGNATPTNQEICYAYGQAASGATTVQITSNPLGSGATQTAFTPKVAHSSGAAIYGATLNVSSQSAALQYMKAMFDVMRSVPKSKVFMFTLISNATVNANLTPYFSSGVKSVTQILNGVYTYLPEYYLAQWYMQNIGIINWTPPLAVRTMPLSASSGAMPLSASANPATLSLTAPLP